MPDSQTLEACLSNLKILNSPSRISHLLMEISLGRAQNWEPPRLNWTKAPLYKLIPHNLEEHPLHLKVNNTPVNEDQLISLFTPDRGSTDMHRVSIRYLDSVPFVVMYWCGASMKQFPSGCEMLDDGYRYFRIFKNSKYLGVSCNGGRSLLYSLKYCQDLKGDNVVWIRFKNGFETAFYQPEKRS